MSLDAELQLELPVPISPPMDVPCKLKREIYHTLISALARYSSGDFYIYDYIPHHQQDPALFKVIMNLRGVTYKFNAAFYNGDKGLVITESRGFITPTRTFASEKKVDSLKLYPAVVDLDLFKQLVNAGDRSPIKRKKSTEDFYHIIKRDNYFSVLKYLLSIADFSVEIIKKHKEEIGDSEVIIHNPTIQRMDVIVGAYERILEAIDKNPKKMKDIGELVRTGADLVVYKKEVPLCNEARRLGAKMFTRAKGIIDSIRTSDMSIASLVNSN